MELKFLLLLLFLTGCASQDDVFQGRAHMAVRRENFLTGRSMESVEKILGKPLMERNEEPNSLWRYQQGNCTTLVYFNENKEVAYAEARGMCPVMKE